MQENKTKTVQETATGTAGIFSLPENEQTAVCTALLKRGGKMNLLAAKIYYDGSHWIAIPHTERPYRQRKRRKKPEKSEELQQFEERFEKVKGGRKSRKAKLLQEFTPMFKDEDEAEQFVEEHFNRLSRNRWERYKRMIRRGYTNRWNFFCTYTFDSRKHTEETFRSSLMNTLYHFSARRDWRYMGAWERGELGERLHFHALTYIPEGQMPGELEEHEDYSTKRHRREKSIQNSFFNERFGRSDFSAVNNAYEVADSIKYMLKYISKNDEKIVYSRGLKTYFVSDVLDEDNRGRDGDRPCASIVINPAKDECIGSDGIVQSQANKK